MAGKVLVLDDFLMPDQLGESLSNQFLEWNMARQNKISQWRELQEYIYATDTRHTTNNKLPWSNTTTIPKLTQIRDNLFSNYIATMFPKRRWLNWEGFSRSDEDRAKVSVIKDYMMWSVNQPQFKETVKKLVLDYIDYGNCFATVEWVDETVENDEGIKVGFVGPRPVRISPIDMVINPTSASFSNTPKMWRSLMSIGEAKEVLERLTATEADREIAESVFDHCMKYRDTLTSYGATDLVEFDRQYSIDGFDSFRRYLESGYVELLTFAGDVYDRESNTLLKNHLVVIIDRCKIAIKREYPYPLAEIPIFHAGWRIRQDNLWAMGPLDNLVGMQYRLDHIENLKADIIDFTAYPVLKIKGSADVGEVEWAPREKIYVDSDGDVDVVQANVNALQYNQELAIIEAKMEEMAGSPKEAMGFRTPGEKTAYEVQRLENAASRIFQNKIAQFEEQVIEPLLNAMLVLAKENLSDATIRVIDDEFGVSDFRTITSSDLSANGRLKPVAARHFAEQAEMIQNLTNFGSSPLAQLIAPHISSVKLARVVEDVLNLEDYGVITPWVQISEAAEAEKMQMAAQEGIMTEGMTPSGLTPDDYSDTGGLEALLADSPPPAQGVPEEGSAPEEISIA